MLKSVTVSSIGKIPIGSTKTLTLCFPAVIKGLLSVFYANVQTIDSTEKVLMAHNWFSMVTLVWSLVKSVYLVDFDKVIVISVSVYSALVTLGKSTSTV